jgi:hypothetical protein
MTASTGELHTASDEWLSNVFLALAKFAVRRPKTRWAEPALFFYSLLIQNFKCIYLQKDSTLKELEDALKKW